MVDHDVVLDPLSRLICGSQLPVPLPVLLPVSVSIDGSLFVVSAAAARSR